MRYECLLDECTIRDNVNYIKGCYIRAWTKQIFEFDLSCYRKWWCTVKLTINTTDIKINNRK